MRLFGIKSVLAEWDKICYSQCPPLASLIPDEDKVILFTQPLKRSKTKVFSGTPPVSHPSTSTYQSPSPPLDTQPPGSLSDGSVSSDGYTAIAFVSPGIGATLQTFLLLSVLMMELFPTLG